MRNECKITEDGGSLQPPLWQLVECHMHVALSIKTRAYCFAISLSCASNAWIRFSHTILLSKFIFSVAVSSRVMVSVRVSIGWCLRNECNVERIGGFRNPHCATNSTVHQCEHQGIGKDFSGITKRGTVAISFGELKFHGFDVSSAINDQCLNGHHKSQERIKHNPDQDRLGVLCATSTSGTSVSTSGINLSTLVSTKRSTV